MTQFSLKGLLGVTKKEMLEAIESFVVGSTVGKTTESSFGNESVPNSALQNNSITKAKLAPSVQTELGSGGGGGGSVSITKEFVDINRFVGTDGKEYGITASEASLKTDAAAIIQKAIEKAATAGGGTIFSGGTPKATVDASEPGTYWLQTTRLPPTGTGSKKVYSKLRAPYEPATFNACLHLLTGVTLGGVSGNASNLNLEVGAEVWEKCVKERLKNPDYACVAIGVLSGGGSQHKALGEFTLGCSAPLEQWVDTKIPPPLPDGIYASASARYFGTMMKGGSGFRYGLVNGANHAQFEKLSLSGWAKMAQTNWGSEHGLTGNNEYFFSTLDGGCFCMWYCESNCCIQSVRIYGSWMGFSSKGPIFYKPITGTKPHFMNGVHIHGSQLEIGHGPIFYNEDMKSSISNVTIDDIQAGGIDPPMDDPYPTATTMGGYPYTGGGVDAAIKAASVGGIVVNKGGGFLLESGWGSTGAGILAPDGIGNCQLGDITTLINNCIARKVPVLRSEIVNACSGEYTDGRGFVHTVTFPEAIAQISAGQLVCAAPSGEKGTAGIEPFNKAEGIVAGQALAGGAKGTYPPIMVKDPLRPTIVDTPLSDIGAGEGSVGTIPPLIRGGKVKLAAPLENGSGTGAGHEVPRSLWQNKSLSGSMFVTTLSDLPVGGTTLSTANGTIFSYRQAIPAGTRTNFKAKVTSGSYEAKLTGAEPNTKGLASMMEVTGAPVAFTGTTEKGSKSVKEVTEVAKLNVGTVVSANSYTVYNPNKKENVLFESNALPIPQNGITITEIKGTEIILSEAATESVKHENLTAIPKAGVLPSTFITLVDEENKILWLSNASTETGEVELSVIAPQGILEGILYYSSSRTTKSTALGTLKGSGEVQLQSVAGLPAAGAILLLPLPTGKPTQVAYTSINGTTKTLLGCKTEGSSTGTVPSGSIAVIAGEGKPAVHARTKLFRVIQVESTEGAATTYTGSEQIPTSGGTLEIANGAAYSPSGRILITAETTVPATEALALGQTVIHVASTAGFPLHGPVPPSAITAHTVGTKSNILHVTAGEENIVVKDEVVGATIPVGTYITKKKATGEFELSTEVNEFTSTVLKVYKLEVIGQIEYQSKLTMNYTRVLSSTELEIEPFGRKNKNVEKGETVALVPIEAGYESIEHKESKWILQGLQVESLKAKTHAIATGSVVVELLTSVGGGVLENAVTKQLYGYHAHTEAKGNHYIIGVQTPGGGGEVKTGEELTDVTVLPVKGSGFPSGPASVLITAHTSGETSFTYKSFVFSSGEEATEAESVEEQENQGSEEAGVEESEEPSEEGAEQEEEQSFGYFVGVGNITGSATTVGTYIGGTLLDETLNLSYTIEAHTEGKSNILHITAGESNVVVGDVLEENHLIPAGVTVVKKVTAGEWELSTEIKFTASAALKVFPVPSYPKSMAVAGVKHFPTKGTLKVGNNASTYEGTEIVEKSLAGQIENNSRIVKGITTTGISIGSEVASAELVTIEEKEVPVIPEGTTVVEILSSTELVLSQRALKTNAAATIIIFSGEFTGLTWTATGGGNFTAGAPVTLYPGRQIAEGTIVRTAYGNRGSKNGDIGLVQQGGNGAVIGVATENDNGATVSVEF